MHTCAALWSLEKKKKKKEKEKKTTEKEQEPHSDTTDKVDVT
jgi:hypothetical protein